MSRTIESLSPGTGIWLYETVASNAVPVEYIYLGLDQSQTPRLLRKNACVQHRMSSVDGASYQGSEADLYLDASEGGFLSRFDQDTLQAFQPVTICYADFSQGGSENAQYISIARRCFLPSEYELGNGGGEGGTNFLPALKTYYHVSNDNTARITKTSSGTAVGAWLRTGARDGAHRYVYSSGLFGYHNSSAGDCWFRPMLAVSPGTQVSEEGAESVFLLPATHPEYWTISFAASLGTTERRPTRAKLFVPNNLDSNDQLTCRICNNYSDDTPTWVDCQNEASVTLGTEKSASEWELGVQIEALVHSPRKCVYEPAMIIEMEALS